jgi:hypothetical protein
MAAFVNIDESEINSNQLSPHVNRSVMFNNGIYSKNQNYYTSQVPNCSIYSLKTINFT